jgi:translocation and assembly module TamB
VLSATGLRIEVPPSVTNDVQPLEDHRDVTISAAVAAPEEEDGDDGVTPINLTASVDDAELKTGQVRVAFATRRGAPIVYQAASEKLGGIIELTAGELNLLGHAFSIERGLVRLREEEPGNPYVSVTARWDAPDGTTVYCDYIGPLKPIDRDKIRFRSSPPLSEDEIIAQLLFGDPGAGVATGKSGDGSQNLGGRIAAQQVNDVLGEIVPGLSTSFGTTEDATSASVAYNFSDRVTAQATFESASGDRAAVGDETAQQTTDGSSTSSRNTKLSIDWRFARNWLLRGSIGLGDEPSSGLDVLWQYRY